MARYHLVEKGKTLFRVLSEEESRKVTRWQAPQLSSGTAVVANTRQHANPHHSPEDENMRPLLGSRALKPDRSNKPSASPQLQTINSIDVFANGAIADMHSAKVTRQTDTAPVAPQASAEMLQSSYDEGYARGFAAGNAALQQHNVKELKQIVSALSNASARPDEAEIEQAVLSLSLDIASLVIRREVSIDDSLMLDIVNAGIEQLPGGYGCAKRVNLHPLDANVVRRHIADSEDIQIVDDPTLDRGACRIESGASVINAGTNDWLHNVSVQLGLFAENEMQINDPFDQQDESSISKPSETQ